MTSERSKNPISPMPLDEIRSKIKGALEGGSEVLILPHSDWSNFVEATSGSIESMAQSMEWNKSTVTNSVMASIGFEPSRYLEAARNGISALRPGFLLEIMNTTSLKIHMKGHSADPAVISLSIECDFVDSFGSIIAQAGACIHFENPQGGGRWEYHTFNFRTSLDGRCTSFSVAAGDEMPL